MALPKPDPPLPLKVGDTVRVEYKEKGLYPTRFTGIVTGIYPKFAIVRVIPNGYEVSVHVTDFKYVRKVRDAR